MSKVKKKLEKEDLFQRQYNNLNQAQKEAVDAIEGPVVVIAGPGTGKSTVLTLRIANILKKTDTAPENILALTFTESGAFVMRKKLAEIIGSPAYRVNIHTFHGFAEFVIRTYPDYFPRIIGSKIITDIEQIKIIEKIIQREDIELLRPYGDPSYYVRPILSEIHLLKRENISPKDLYLSIKEVSEDVDEKNKTEAEKIKKRNEKNNELAIVFERYEQALAQNKYYDFDDMLLELIRTLEKDETFKLILQESYQYILADEHQDANASQNRILELLSDFHQSPNLFIVGDDKQAIYRFQGASLENFLYFQKRYTDARVIELEHNYRSHQGILDASHSLIEKNLNLIKEERKRLISQRKESKKISILEFENKKDEIEYVVNEIDKLIKNNVRPDSIAILYRENKEAFELVKVLNSKGIANRVESDSNIFEGVDATKIVVLCRAINDLSSSENLGKALLLKELGCDPASVMELFNYSRRRNIALFRVIERMYTDDLLGLIDDKKKKEIDSAYRQLKNWAKQGQELGFSAFLHSLIQQSNIVKSILSASNSLERLSSLDTFFDHILKLSNARQTFFLRDFIEYLDIMIEHGIMAKLAHIEHVNGVRLMTAHRAKGLEFDYVFIVNVVYGVWGNRNKRNSFSVPVIEHARDNGLIEDERRLFYVAMTRAKEHVTVSYSRFSEERETIPSQFIEEIDKSLVEFNKPIISDRIQILARRFVSNSSTTSLSIFEKNYIRSRFLSQPLSVTHINNYLQCPWEYFFVNLIRLPQAETKHQMYGTAIHDTLRTFFEAYKEERDLSKKELLNLFSHNLEAKPMSVGDRRESLDKGKDSLSGYYDEYMGTWNRNLLTEYSIKAPDFSIGKDAKLILTGKLDKIEILDDGKVAVIDYKTSKPKSKNEIEGKTRNANGNYKRQLVFYQLLLDLDRKYRMTYGVIDFIEPNDRGIYKKEQFVISKEEVSELESVISNMAQSVSNFSFSNSDCGNKNCQYCQLVRTLKL